MGEPSLETLSEDLEQLIAVLQDKNASGSPTRSRDLSVAITNLETGQLWLIQAINRAAAERGE